MTKKQKHKDLKKLVLTKEMERNTDRSWKSWFDLRNLKKMKLKAKDKLKATKWPPDDVL
jgi:hypothetical protein